MRKGVDKSPGYICMRPLGLVGALFLLLIFTSQTAQAQSGRCSSSTPFLRVDLRGAPDSAWSSPYIGRRGTCCGTSSPDRCIEFEVTLDSSAVGLTFGICFGAAPPGHFYQVNCGDSIPMGTPVCLTTPGPHTITYCKPGSNREIYCIESFAGPGTAIPDSTYEGCEVLLTAYNFEDSSIVWRDITSGTGRYDSMLSCTRGCDSTYFLPDTGIADSIILFEVCGRAVGACVDSTLHCDTVEVRIRRPLGAHITFTPPDSCSSSPTSLYGTVLNTFGRVRYYWSGGPGGADSIGLDDSLVVTASGTYYFIAYDSLYPHCSNDTAEVFVPFLFLETGLDGNHRLCRGDSIYLSASVRYGSDYRWSPSIYVECDTCEATWVFPPTDTTFTVSVTDSFGCSNIDTFRIILEDGALGYDTMVMCRGDSILIGGVWRLRRGVYFDSTLFTAGGCDSVVRVVLRDRRSNRRRTREDICRGDSIYFEGRWRINPGTHIEHYFNRFGCDSIIELELRVRPVPTDTVDRVLCDGDSILVDTFFVDTSGQFSYMRPGPGFCDSNIIVRVALAFPYDTMRDTTICSGDSIFLAGAWYGDSVLVDDSLLGVDGCDSVIRYQIHLLPEYTSAVNDTFICSGDSLFLAGSWVSDSLLVLDSFLSANGCDSVIQYQVHLWPEFTSAVTDTFICSGDSLFLAGSWVSDSLLVLDSFLSANGCDSVIQYQVHLWPEFTSAVNDTFICSGDSLFLAGSWVSDSLLVLDSLTTVNGCDSVIQYQVHLWPEFTSAVTDTFICSGDSLFLAGSWVSDSLLVLDSFLSANGCDSVIQYQVHLWPEFTSAVNDTFICSGDSLFLAGSWVSDSLLVLDSFLSANGCDSVIQYQVHLWPEFTSAVNDTFICSGDSLFLAGSWVSDSLLVLDSLTTVNGCDSVIQYQVHLWPEFISAVNDTFICSGDSLFLAGSWVSDSLLVLDSFLSANGCDSVIRYQVHLWPEFISAVNDTFICSGDSLFLAGSWVSDSLLVLDSFLSANGCDSVIQYQVHLWLEFTSAVNDTFVCSGDSLFLAGSWVSDSLLVLDSFLSANGCDSVIQYQVHLWPEFTSAVNDTFICSGDSLFLAGSWVSDSLLVLDSFLSANGCDSVIQYQVHLWPEFTSVVNDTFICSGDSLFLAGSWVSDSLLVLDSFLSANGCDSVIQYQVHLWPEFTSAVNDTFICSGDSLFLAGSWVSDSLLVLDSLTTVNGCDSVIQYQVHLWPEFTSAVNDTFICSGDSLFLAGSWVSDSLLVLDSLTTVNGCDSVIQYQVHLWPEFTSAVNDTFVCSGDSLFLAGSWVSDSLLVLDSFLSANGCDSVIQYQVHLWPEFTSAVNDTFICSGDSLFLAGSWVSDSLLVLDSFLSANGCDSVIQYQVHLWPEYTSAVIDTFICSGDSLFLAGTWVSDSLLVLDSFLSANGCDSVIQYQVHLWPEFTSAVNDTFICSGDSLFLAGSWVSDSLLVLDSFLSANGCDSVIQYQVHLWPEFISAVNDTFICSGDSLFLAGSWVSDSLLVLDSFLSANGCDSVIQYQVHLWPEFISAVNDTFICSGDSLFLAGSWVSDSLLVLDSFLSADGCDSVIQYQVHLWPEFTSAVNDTFVCSGDSLFLAGSWVSDSLLVLDSFLSANGCDSVIQYQVHLWPEFISAVNDTFICSGDSLFLAGSWVSDSLLVLDSFLSADGCDSVIQYQVHLWPEFTSAVNDTFVCSGDSLFLAGSWVSDSLLVLDSFLSANGCDSVIQYQVHLWPEFTSVVNDTFICSGDSLFLAGSWVSDSLLVLDSFLSANGCDSVIQYQVHLWPEFTSLVNDTFICSGDSLFLAGSWVSDSLLVLDSFLSANGCDSVIQYQVHLWPEFTSAVNDTFICSDDSLFLAGSWVSDSLLVLDSLTTANGCDSVIQYQVHLWPEFTSAVNDTFICSGDSLFLAGSWVSDSLLVLDSLTTVNGCDSVIQYQVHLWPEFTSAVNDTFICSGDSLFLAGSWVSDSLLVLDSLTTVNGCDSVIQYQVHLWPEFTSEVNDTFICSGDSLFLAGSWVSDSLLVLDSFLSANGCDSVIQYQVHLWPEFTSAVNDTFICSGDSLFLAGTWVSDSLLVLDSLTTVNGCDSVIQYQVHLWPEFTSAVNDTFICSGDSLFLAGSWVSDSLLVLDSFLSANGCDSVIQYQVHLWPEFTSAVNDTFICSGDSLFLAGSWVSDSLLVLDSFLSANGCDSVIQYQVHLWPEFTSAVNDTFICSGDSLFLAGSWVSDSLLVLDSFLSANGCDSVIQYQVHLWPEFTSAVNDTFICSGDSLFLAGSWVSDSLLVLDSFLSANGCDSVIQYQVHLWPEFTSAVNDTFICSGDSLFLAGSWVSDSLLVLDSFLSANGCDSVIQYQVHLWPEFTSAVNDTFICSGDSLFLAGSWVSDSLLVLDSFLSANGCDSVIQYQVHLWPEFTSAVNDTFICSGDSLFLAGSWVSDSLLVLDSLTTVNGCDSVIQYQVHLWPEFISAVNDTFICSGDSLFLAGSWVSDSLLVLDSFLSANGCDSVIQYQVHLFPTFDLDSTIDVCANDSVLILGNYYSPGDSFIDNGVTVDGCDSSMTYRINTLPIHQQADTLTICPGDSVFVNGRFLADSGIYVDSFLNVFACDSIITTFIIFLPSSRDTTIIDLCVGDSFSFGGSYYTADVSLTDSFLNQYGCDSLHSFLVRFNPNVASVDARSNGPVFKGSPILLTASGSGYGTDWTYNWYHLDGTPICFDCESTSLIATSSRYFVVEFIDEFGCAAYDTVWLEVLDQCEDAIIDIPNAVTPDGNGRNDTWYVKYAGLEAIALIRIYNRWGQLMFETRDPDVHWDGTFREELVNPGVYVYYIETICLEGSEKLIKGNITVIR